MDLIDMATKIPKSQLVHYFWYVNIGRRTRITYPLCFTEIQSQFPELPNLDGMYFEAKVTCAKYRRYIISVTSNRTGAQSIKTYINNDRRDPEAPYLTNTTGKVSKKAQFPHWLQIKLKIDDLRITVDSRTPDKYTCKGAQCDSKINYYELLRAFLQSVISEKNEFFVSNYLESVENQFVM